MLATLALVVLIIPIIYYAYYYASNKEYRKLLAKIKSEPCLPIIGHVLNLGKTNDDLLPSLERMWKKFGRDKFRIKIGPLDQVVITKPEDVEVILSSNQLITKNVLYKLTNYILGNGLLTGKGEEWRSHRKILTPAFHFKILQSYLYIMEQETANLMKLLQQRTNVDIDVFPVFYHRALITLCRLGIGGIDDSIDIEEYSRNLQIISALTNKKFFSSWKSIDFIYNLTSEGKQLKRCIDTVIKNNTIILEIRKEEHKDAIGKVNSGELTMDSMVIADDFATKKPLCFMELLLFGRKPNGEPLSDKDIMYELNTFTIAGHETLTSSSSFTLYSLANNPEIQDKVFEEQMQITEGDLQKSITYDDLQQMKYLERVIKESLRMHSPALAFGRQITTKTVLPDGIVLPIGCDVILMPYLTHSNPDVFPDPEKFNPDRFLEKMPNPYMYYPFSAGPRNCIGQKLAMLQLKFWLSTIIRSLELLPASGPKPKLIMELAMKSATGVLIQVRERRTL